MKILIAGTNFTNQNNLKNQGQFLFDIISKTGIPCQITSSKHNFILRIIDTLLTLFRFKKNDIVILQIYSTKSLYLSYLTAVLAKLKCLKIISTLHGGNLPNVYKNNPVKRSILNQLFRKSIAITAPSHFTQIEIEPLKNNPKFNLIRNLIHLDEYQVSPKSTTGISIFWMRAYQENYNPQLAIEVVEYLKSNGENVKMIMAGKDYGLKSKLLKLIESKNLLANIEVRDVINNHEKNEIANTCNVYLCTNTVDNAPVTFLEMMAMGLPIVSTSVGGIPYFVEHNKTAILAKDNTKEDLAKSIVELLHHKELYDSLIKNGLENCQLYGEQFISQSWLKLITEVNNK